MYQCLCSKATRDGIWAPWVLCVVTLAALVFAGNASAAVIYTEGFPNTSSPLTSQNFSTVGWNAFIGATATDYTNTTNVSSSDPAVIWTSNGQSGTPSYGFASNVSAGALYYTTEPGLLDPTTLDTIAFYINNGNTTAALRVAVELDTGQWFATDTAYTHSVGLGSSSNWSTNAQQEVFTYTGTGSAWRDLTFTPGTTLSLASSARTSDLPAGNIAAVGLYALGSSVRFDTFTVSAVPEPSTIVILAGLLLGILACVRRRS